MIRKSIDEDTILFLEGNQKNIDLINEAKHRAEMCNITVTELFNRALEDYLNNHI